MTENREVLDALLNELMPWQKAVVEAAWSGKPTLLHHSRRSGKHQVAVGVAAFWEATLESWDAVGPDASRLRREARELAAKMTAGDLQEGETK